MSVKTEQYSDIYRDLWNSGTRCWPAAAGTRKLKDSGFCARHHTFRRRGAGFRGTGHGLFVNEVYESVFECLACYRWYRIPSRLAQRCQAEGGAATRDIELLLDAVGYSTSLIAEELFAMIDSCLERGICTPGELHAIRLAYNGLSGFDDPVVSRITSWGPVATVLSDESLSLDHVTPRWNSSGLLRLVESGLFDPHNSGHISAADSLLRITSAV